MDDQKTILIATPLYPPEIGGPATYTRALEEELPRYGYDTITIKWSETKWWPPIIRELAYFIKVNDAASDACIVYAQDPVAVGLPAMLAARALRRRFFLKVVGDRAWEEDQRRRPSLIDPLTFQTRRLRMTIALRRMIERSVAKVAERVIVPSEYLKKVVMLWGVDPGRIVVIRNGLPAIAFPTREEARGALHVDPSTFLVVSIGRLSPWKGFPSVINAFVRIRVRNPGVRLVIIGDGTPKERKALESEIEKHGLEEYVTMTGALPREEVLRYLAAADLFVLNTFYEGFSHQILEAMASGTPVVTTDAGGNAEIVRDRENARLVPFNDDAAIAEAILELSADPVECARLAARAKADASQYTEAKSVEELITHFK